MRRVMGVGSSYWEWLWRKVQCLECGAELVVVSLMDHNQWQHSIGKGNQGRLHPTHNPTPQEAKPYWAPFPAALKWLIWSVEGFQGGVTSLTNLWVHFLHRHIKDTIVILEEGNQPYPHWNKCEMFFSQRSLNGRHPSTALCQPGGEGRGGIVNSAVWWKRRWRQGRWGQSLPMAAHSHWYHFLNTWCGFCWCQMTTGRR